MIRRITVVVLALLAVAAAGFVASAWLSLDRSRSHRAATAELPLLRPGSPDGLVRIRANGLVFRARVAGLGNSGSGVILLHGFPETSAMWTPLIDEAARAGYRVVAFDQRGYSPEARPEEVGAYVVTEIVDDVIAVADAVGFERFHLVGHDWGCVAGWITVVQHPERIQSWTGLSIPHPGPLIEEMRGDPPAYIRVFQTPWLPELLLSARGLAGVLPDATAWPELHEEYRAVFSEPGAIGAALAWYRAIPASLELAGQVSFEIERPTLFLWGSREGWVSGGRLEQQRPLIRGPYRELELDAGHWLMREQTERVVEEILAHWAQAQPPSADSGT